MLYTGSNDRTIRVWDLSTYQCVGMMVGHSLAVISLAGTQYEMLLAITVCNGDK
jgi:WD40 repeat protein